MLEVVLGIAVLLNYRVKITYWLLLIIIVFFTFLTFYSAYFDKVTDCGCFGDAIKLTPWESFIKDIILTIFIAFLFLKRDLVASESEESRRNGFIAFHRHIRHSPPSFHRFQSIQSRQQPARAYGTVRRAEV